MLKAGMLPAPVIQPLRYDTIGTRIRVGTNTYIQIKSDVPGARILFTTDGTKPDPFQLGRTGKRSTNRYIGPFRLQLGNRVVKAIVVSRDRLRESQIATRYIDVVPMESSGGGSDRDLRYGYPSDRDSPSSSGEEESQFMRGGGAGDIAELQGSVEGPINPVNYSGTQINVWGFPTPELTNFLAPRPPPQTQMGFLTEQMIKNLNTPRNAIESKPSITNLPETLRKFFKQVQKIYERDTDFQKHLDYLIENGQLKSAEITQNPRNFEIVMICPKFLIDEPPPEKVTRPPPTAFKPRPHPPPPRPRPVSPEPEVIISRPTTRPDSPPPKIITSPPVKIEEKPKKEEPPQQPPPPKDTFEPSLYVEENVQQGTIVDAPNFNAEKDAEALRKSVKGLGTRESVIISICGNRSNAQRLKTKDVYKAMFGRDLIEDLKGDTSGNFKKLLVGLHMSPVEYDCMEIRKAIQGLGTDNSTLIELLTSRSNKRLKEVSALYHELYKKKMEDDIRSDTSGHYRNLLTSLLAFSRPETSEVDMNLVRQDVDELIKAGPKRWGTDESKFNTIFGTRSYAHLRKVFDEYERKTKKTMEDTIKSEMSGNLAKTYLALIANIRSRPVYFAKEIKKAIKGLGTDEHTLNRIVISRCEVDMKQIKEEYVRLFTTTMEKDVTGDVSGDYRKLLLELIKDPSERVYEGGSGPEEPHEMEQVEEPHIEQTPTVVDFAGFNSNSDSERLRKAMKGLGTDEKVIIEIIPRRSNKQRQQLKTTFQAMFGRDLVQDLHSELSGHFRDAIEALMMLPDEFEAFSYRKAVKGFGTDDSALIELLTTREPEEINTAKIKYKQMYGRDLEADVRSDTSGHYRNVLTSLLTASRPSGNMVDKTQARIDVEELIKAGVKKWGTDESKFVTILCIRSYAQLRAMFVEYERQAGRPIEEDIKKETSGELQKIFLAIIACVRDKQAYFAQVLYKAMKGFGTKESAVIRVIVSRSEVDMVQIKQKFEEAYKKSLRDFLKGDLSGDFLKTMLPLIGEN